MTTSYERPATLEEALELLGRPGALPMFGGTDLVGQIDRGIVEPQLLVDMQHTGLHEIEEADEGLSIGAGVTLATLASSALVAPYTAIVSAASTAASPILRNVGTVGGNLCQGTRCWYFRGEDWHCWLGGGDTCYAQIGDHRKHGLKPGDCISAHPSDLAPALAACGARVVVVSTAGERTLDLSDLYRTPSEDNRSLVTLGRGEIISEVLLPRPALRSSFRRLGERQAFSFPLVCVAAALRDGVVSAFAGGVANIPVRLDPLDPLATLPGNPQTMWKRTALATLTARVLSDIAQS
jgi:xanthine dehydrogenase YagS FAD-binding subunit